jgi:2,3-diaminopropionate biosynthesis protein SbnB
MSGRAQFLWLSQEDVIAAGGLDMVTTMQDVTEVYRLHANGQYVLPGKIVLQWEQAAPEKAAPEGVMPGEEKEDHINTMPGYLGGRYDVAGLKVIASLVQNPRARGLPRATALIVLHDTEVGLPLTVMDGTLISAMRTGAMTGVAARYLAREEITRVGLIGAGVQNRTQLMALQVARPGIQSVTVFDIRPKRAQAFAAEMGRRLGFQVHVALQAEEAVREAEIVVTATTTARPIVREGWLVPGCLYAHISGYECEYAVIRHADKVVVDDWDQVKHRMASTVALMWRDGAFADKDLYAEMSEIVTGQKPGRENNDEVIVFSPIGLGLYDLAVARRIYQAALKGGLGQRLALWQDPLWI